MGSFVPGNQGSARRCAAISTAPECSGAVTSLLRTRLTAKDPLSFVFLVDNRTDPPMATPMDLCFRSGLLPHWIAAELKINASFQHLSVKDTKMMPINFAIGATDRL